MPDLTSFRFSLSAWLGTPMVRRCLLAVTGATVLGLGGCAVYTPAQTVYDANGQPVVYSQPAPVQEVVTVRPAVNMVWVPGVWFWGGTRYHWRAGHWAHPSRAYAHPGWRGRSWAGTPRVGHAPRVDGGARWGGRGGWRR